jgi:3-oxoacyl-[acyl-carrier protein] reductase
VKGRTAIVSGGSSGIGAEIARALGNSGARVLVAGRNAERAAQVVAEIEDTGGEAMHAHHDLEDPESARSVVAAAREAFGPVELLVNNAGTFFQVPFTEVTPEEFDRAMHINVRGAFLLTQAAIPDMVAGQFGRVVFISSTASDYTRAGSSLYGTSKAALNGLMRTLVAEYGRDGVTFNCISPGLVPTRLTASVLSTEEGRASYAHVHANGRVGTTKEVAHIALMLLDDLAGHTMSQNVYVEGGMTRTVRHAAPPPPDDA